MVHILIISKFVDFPVLSCVYICFICVVFNAMTSKPSSSEDAQSAIEQLQSVLEQNYLRAEKIMALRNPNNELLKEILTEINHDYDALIGAMASANLGSEAIVAVTQNQNEFESRKDEWFTKVKESSSASVSTMPHLLYEPHRSPSHVSSTSYSRHSLKSSRSSSSRHSRKHLEAKARLKMAQLESNHLEERVREEEQRLRLEAEEREQRLRLEAEEREKRLNLETETKQKHFQLKRMIEKGEASRKIALAEVEYQVYCEHDSIYKLSCDDITAATSIANSDDTISTVVADPSKQIEALSSQVSVAGSLPAQSSLNIGLAQGSLPAQSSLITGPAQGSLPVRSSLVADSAQGSLPSKPFLNSGPAQGSLTVRPSLVADSAQGSLPVRSSLVADSAQGSLPSKPFLNSGPAQGSLTVRPSLVADSAQGFLPVRSSLVADSAQGSLPFKSSLNSGPAQGSLLAQPSLTADPVQSSQHAPATFSSVYGHPPVRPYNTFVDKAYSSIQPQPFAPSSQVHDAQPVGVPAAQLDSSHPSRVVTSSTPPSVSCANNNLMNSNNLLLPVHLPGLYTPSAANYDSLFLPRPEFTKFSGDPLEFKTFMSNFETHVEPRVRDEKALFCLLLQHCTGEVKNRIEYLSTSETQPYTLAKQRLTKDYGSPWVIADVCEQQLKKFPSIKSGDGRQMRRFAELLEKTNVVVKDIRQYTSLDTLDTLSELLGKLPYDLKRRWVKKSVQVETSFGHLANFSHFVDFIRNESEEVNSLFGLRSLHPKTSPSKPKVKTSSFGVVTSKSTSIKSSESKSSAQPGSCYFCKDTSHMLWDCKKFRGKTVQDRICFVKELKLCHKCLSARHRTPECKKNNTCSSSGCKGLYHHTLLHKPDKVRIVFDCAAKYNGLSLNDALMKGPHLMNNLTGVLTRFREKEIALVADVEAMFHQVRVDPMHTNALRFLWWENGNVNQEPIICQMLVHLFGATSSPSCANFSLRQTALEFGHHYDPVISSIVNNNFYVDDCLVSLSSVQEASYVYHNLTKLLERRGFHLTKWITNNERVLSEIPESERSTKAQQYLLGNQTDDRILGIQWKVNEDQFTFDIKIPNKPFTRRGLLSTVASLFDPLGFVAPVLLEAKRLLQVLCKQNLGWDELIGDAEQKRWKDWLESLPALNNVKVPRCFKPADFGRVVTVQIHHFADASSYGYGACSYLRLVNEQGIICLSFLMGKSRLAAMKSVSIPRLELTAAVLAVRLDELTKGELDLSVPSFFWIVSTAVLYCIKNITKRFPVFVANRLATIETHTDVNQWHHVPSSLNPADAASRGLEADNSISKNWLQGPSFLLQPQSKWPSLEATMDEPPNELRPVKAQTVQTIIKTNRTEEAIDRLINHCSSFHKLKRLTAWFLRVMLFLQHCVMKKTFSMSKSLSVDELRNAEAVLIKHVQHQQFPDCFASKSNKLNLPRNLQKLQPIVVDGILRVGGRLKQAPFDIDVKHPIIIPQRSHLTELVIRQHHAEVGHSGSSHTWTSLRRKFWIIKGGAAVRKSIGNCYLCKKRNSNVGKQLMADIPSCRLQFDKPAFSSVGEDYFGPVMVKLLRNKLVKRYGCIFTCLTMRAVHIEIAHSLDTDSFINALRRFIARRGRPQNIFSDNGTNFVGAAKVLRESLRSLNENKIHQYCSQQDINWTFNPPTASHMGGAWERMIRSIRKILKGILGAQTLNDEGLLTFITEVESIINSRPLVPVSFSDTSQDPLTPNHLLLLRGNPNLPPGLFFKEDCYTRRRWAQIQFLANQFWKRWMDEFVPNLLHRQKWFEVKKNLQVNDVVLLVEDMTQRSKWVMGRVLETYPDKRGLVRTVLVKTQTNVVKRPIAKLCPVVTHAD